MVNHARIAVAALAAVLAGGCDSFEDPDVVIDLRVLAMTAEPPTQVIAVDPVQPISPVALFAQLKPTTVCAYVADPGPARRLIWSLSLCPRVSSQRCSESSRVLIGGGVAEDPDLAIPAPVFCARVEPSEDLARILMDAYEDDELGGLGGLEYSVLLRVGGENDDPALDVYANKTLRVEPGVVSGQQSNQNPRLLGLMGEGGSLLSPGSLSQGRCADGVAGFPVRTGDTVRITPLELGGTREHYTVPTIDGHAQSFTESLTYQWIASADGLSNGTTGGPREITGGFPPLVTEYRVPSPGRTGQPRISLWVVQRDERLGASFFETCLAVQASPTSP